jgi:hypothetical protein
MDRTATSRRPLTARLLAVCALVVGLFLMHGMPMAAADGCHGMTATSMSMPQTAPAAMASHAPGSATGHLAEDVPHVSSVGMDGTLCVSTPAHEPLSVAAVGALALVVFAAWTPHGRRSVTGGMRWRGPPGGGRGMLLRVCVART